MECRHKPEITLNECLMRTLNLKKRKLIYRNRRCSKCGRIICANNKHMPLVVWIISILTFVAPIATMLVYLMFDLHDRFVSRGIDNIGSVVFVTVFALLFIAVAKILRGVTEFLAAKYFTRWVAANSNRFDVDDSEQDKIINSTALTEKRFEINNTQVMNKKIT